MSQVMDLELESHFDPTQWLKCGKIYSDVPHYVRDEFLQLLKPPEVIIQRYPAPNMPVPDFTQLVFPDQSNALVYPAPALWFQSERPTNLDLESVWNALVQQPIPPAKLITELRGKAGQAWLDGALSIRNPGLRSEAYLPFWVLGVYKKYSELHQAQLLWQTTIDHVGRWINQNPRIKEQHPTVASVLGQVGWAAETTHGSFTLENHRFATLLQPVMLHDEESQCMTQWIRERVASDPRVASQHHVCGSRFYLVFEGLSPASKLLTDADLARGFADIEIQRRADPDIVVWVPIFRDAGNRVGHEQLMRVDFRAETVGYGDSIPTYPAPAKVIRGAQTWYKKRFGRSLKNVGRSVVSGTQKDSISCILTAMNMMNAAIFGDPLWEPEKWQLDRISWFKILTRTMTPQKPTVVDAALAAALPRTRYTLVSLLNPESDREQRAFMDAFAAAEEQAQFDSVPITVQDLESFSYVTFADEPFEKCEPDVTMEDVDMVTSATDDDDATAVTTATVEATASVSTIRGWSDLMGKMQAAATAADTGDKRKRASTSSQRKKPRTSTTDEGRLGPVGIANSSISDAKARQSALGYGVDTKKQQKFEAKIKETDPDATFDESRFVTCSRCKLRVACDLYRPRYFLDHYGGKKCIKRQPPSVKNTLKAAKYSRLFKAPAPEPPRPVLPCPGLTTADHELLETYIKRSPATGGGSRCPRDIALDMFGKEVWELTAIQKAQVLTQRRHEAAWTTEHIEMRVFATKCTTRAIVRSVASRADDRPRPCHPCAALLANPRFRAVLAKPMPDPDDMRYTNHGYRNTILASQYAQTQGLRDLLDSEDPTNIYVRFMRASMNGAFKGEEVFLGLMHAMLQRKDREQRGVGNQNFTYLPEWEEFVHIIRIHSPRAYSFLSSHFPVPHVRTLQRKEAKQPKLSMTISPANFKMAKKYLHDIKYDGPVAVACDDSKLFSSLRLTFDPVQNCHVLVGAEGGPICVPDANAVSAVLSDPSVVKGTKLRLWTLQVPLPNAMPIIVAAVPIRESLKVPELVKMHEQILYGLLDEDINVVSYSSDGTDTERSVQHDFEDNKASDYIKKTIHIGEGLIVVRVGIYRGKPIIIMQDSKHALKTMRNNLFSGARVLVLGNHTATFAAFYRLAFEDGTPLYQRDVVKLDRQDDKAAARATAAATLRFIVDKHPEERGLIVFLFIAGEAIDVFQNRHISHYERIVMALRARLFLDRWLQFIDLCPGYERARYIISREALDIFRILLNGYLGLVIVYRDYYPGFPLLPWLHSTEACEHIFGLARQVVKDFSALDFYRMVPKLNLKMHEALFGARRETAAQSKATASGYDHSWMKLGNLNIQNLSDFPTDSRWTSAAKQASDEANNLLLFLGIQLDSVSDGGALPDGLPSLNEMLSDETFDDLVADPEDIDQPEATGDSTGELFNLVAQTQANEFVAAASHEANERLESLSYAALASLLRDQQKIAEMEPIDDETEEIMLADTRQSIAFLLATLEATAVELSVPPTLVPDNGTELCMENLVELRERHQTDTAAKAVRAVRPDAIGTSVSNPSDEQIVRADLIRAFHDQIRLSQDRGVTTGIERNARIKAPLKSAPGGRAASDAPVAAGNSSNAVVAAAAASAQAAGKRNRCWTAAGVPMLLDHTAGVCEQTPVAINSFGIIYREAGLQIGRVTDIYWRSSGNHAFASHSSSISAISYLVVQFYECANALRNHFKAVTSATGEFDTITFLHIPSTHFLRLLTHPAELKIGPAGIHYQLHPPDWKVFTMFRQYQTRFKEALRRYGQRKGAEDVDV
ncbi:hypothetical protein GGX14DRAFT_587166 [Mycena pura]|uniref:THAP9-like helix-turn-helix domain-containing protein n=1 Tax=Mycena pura TaxID=153505 RepID=A0AAD6UWZ8_9AGAR|nr:hypothetical protein GGX14DRAFT_587166 [Mycena pura]